MVLAQAVLLQVLLAGPVTAFRISGRGLKQQQTTDVELDNGLLLHSMHCFDSEQPVFLQNADWNPSTWFVVRCFHFSSCYFRCTRLFAALGFA